MWLLRKLEDPMNAAVTAREKRHLALRAVVAGTVGLCAGAYATHGFFELIGLTQYWVGVWTGTTCTLGAIIGGCLPLISPR